MDQGHKMVDCKNQNIEWYSLKMLEENNGDLGSSRETLNKLNSIWWKKPLFNKSPLIHPINLMMFSFLKLEMSNQGEWEIMIITRDGLSLSARYFNETK